MTDAASSAVFAEGIINAVNAAAASAGFGDVVLSTSAE
eukprot:COSAG03_NODE_3660_length_1894_cov_1.836212_1_plen_37_part_10